MDTEEKIEAKTSHTLSEVTTQLEIELEEPSLAEEVPVQQLQPFSFHAASTSDSDEMDKRNDESLQADILQQESSSLQEDNSLQEYSSLQEDSLLQGGSSLQEDNSQQEDISLQEDSMLQGGSLLQEDSLPQGGSLLQEDNSLQEVSSRQEDSLSQGGSLLQEDSSQPEESWGEETSNKLNYLHSIETGSSEPTSSFQAEQSEPVVSYDKAKHELNVSQDESRLRKRSYESTSENTDIDDLQKEGSSPEADISSEEDVSRRKKKCLEKRRRFDYTSITDKDKGEKIDFDKPSSSVPKEQSKPVVSCSKTKPQLDIPQEASKLRKRSYETTSESTDIDIGDLQKPGSSLKSDISPKAYGSPMKRKCLELRKRYDSSSTTDEDNNEKIGFEKPYSSVPKEQSKPVVSRGKTKHQLDIPQEASKLRKRSYETSSESTDIDIGDLPKP
ncbi:PREDICTED: microtubule-associated protein 1A-like, partial [Polistes dominula]|uniref:Microtubule-associated protein 1A-like n=1 Tax=Polistes dominula TaxID=743375 RepID=A0ABM1JBU5_POLDO